MFHQWHRFLTFCSLKKRFKTRFARRETFEICFKDESCLFWKCEGEGKRVESHFNHRTNVQKWKGFSALPAHFLMRLCCKKGACNFSTSHFVNHLRWFENMQRRLTGIRHMKSNYLHAIFWAVEMKRSTNCKPAQKNPFSNCSKTLKLARRNCEQV